MISLGLTKRSGPIGVDVGTHSVKLVQFSADGSRMIDAARWDFNQPGGDGPPSPDEMAAALKQARQGRRFAGNDAVLCLGRRELFLQNVRIAKSPGADLSRLVHQEAAARLPYSLAEAEIHFLEAADVRQGDATLREVIVCACHRPKLDELLGVAELAGLNPVAVDIEPGALVRAYANQFRRDEDRSLRWMLVHVGFASAMVVIAQGEDPLFVNYIDQGGRNMDAAVARHLNMKPADAAALRRNNGDRRADQQDPEVTQSIAQATRPVIEELIRELSMCIRYHSVTFRGQPLARMVLGGGEATESLLEVLSRRLDLKCELGRPLRSYKESAADRRPGQWDVAAGLALRQMKGPS